MPLLAHAHTRQSAWLLSAAALCAACANAAPYELRIYSDDIPPAGESELESIASTARPIASMNGPQNRVSQMLLEYGYGLGNGWTMGLELPMSHTDGRNKLNGLKVEAQYVTKHDPHQGMYWGVRGDVGYTSSPYESQGGNSADINPILGYRWSQWHIVVNPSVEIQISGPNKHTQFQPSAKLARAISGTTQLGVEYFSEWGRLSALRPQRERDEMLYAVWDEKLAHRRWNLGLGKPIHPSGGPVDKWVLKIGVNLDLD